MKRALPVLLLTLSVFLAGAEEGKSLTWSLSLIGGRRDGTISFSRPIRMADGENFSMVFNAEKTCSCYVIFRDSQNTSAVLYNGRLNAGREFTLGPLEITPPSGTETIYVIVGLDSVTDLDKRIKEFTDSGSSRKASDALIDSVLALRRSVSALAEAPEKPVQMGGAFRGTESRGVTCSGADFYVKTITIRH